MDASELTRRRQARTVFRGFADQKEYNERTNTVANKGDGVNIGTKMSGSGLYPEWVYLVQQGSLFTLPEELQTSASVATVTETDTVSLAAPAPAPAAPAGPTGAVGQAQWATYLGVGDSSVNSRGVIVDSQGNVYITGSYNYRTSSITVQDVNGTTQIPSSISLPASSSGGAIFIIKYNQSGQAQWATCVDGLSNASGSTSSPDSGLSVGIDSQDNLYISGYYTSTYSITIKDANGITQSNSAITLSTLTTQAACLIKYNSNGIAQWATYIDGTGTFDQSAALYIDTLNNIYVTGQYQQATTVLTLKNVSGTTQVNSSYTLPISTGADTFVVKYDSNGQVLWGTTVSGTGADYGYYITGDSSGNIYITGQTRSPTIKDVSGYTQINSSVTLQTMSNTSMYLVCYNSSGIAQWATYVNPSNTTAGYGISLDSQNNIYVTGFYTHSQSISSTFVLKDASGTGQSDSLVTLPHTTLNGTNNQSIFLIKYNSSGKVQWAVGIITAGLSLSGNVVCDSTDNVYICGRYSSTNLVYLPNANGNIQTNSSISLPIPPPSGTNPDAYLIKYNSFGQAQWGLNIGSQGGDYGNSLIIDKNGYLYITGVYAQTTSTVIINNANGNGQTNSGISMPPPQSIFASVGYLIKYN